MYLPQISDVTMVRGGDDVHWCGWMFMIDDCLYSCIHIGVYLVLDGNFVGDGNIATLERAKDRD